MITAEMFWMGRDVEYANELTPDLLNNATDLLERVNRLLGIYYSLNPGAKRIEKVTSGWRPAAINSGVPGAAKGSNHMKCLAVDLDDDGPFDRWCFEHPEYLAECSLWLEHPGWTDGWCHLQSVPPKSGEHVRVFIPNNNDPMTMAYGRSPVIWRA